MIKINPYISKNTGTLYDENDFIIGKFNNSTELLDIRFQIMSEQIEGYYVIFDRDFNQKCKLLLDGDISEYPPLNAPKSLILRRIYNYQLNNVKQEYIKTY